MGKFFRMTREFLEQTPPVKLCKVNLKEGDYSGFTAFGVGGLCKEDLLKAMDHADEIGLTLLCTEDYDRIFIMRGDIISDPVSMNPRQIEALGLALRLWILLNGNYDMPIEALKRVMTDEGEHKIFGEEIRPISVANAEVTTREAFEAEFESYAKRAHDIGNLLYLSKRRGIEYYRPHRTEPGKPAKIHFTTIDAYDPSWNQYKEKWIFCIDSPYEIDMLKHFLEHDETIYARCFSQKN